MGDFWSLPRYQRLCADDLELNLFRITPLHVHQKLVQWGLKKSSATHGGTPGSWRCNSDLRAAQRGALPVAGPFNSLAPQSPT